MKTTLLFLFLAVACGNPHLEKFDGLGSKNVPVIAEPHVLTALGLKSDLGLNYETTEASLSKTTELLNLDTDKDWNLEVTFEKGDHFRLKGNSFPGTDGTCLPILSAKESCRLDVEFFADAVGFYADNLKIKYTSNKDAKDIRYLSIALRGERKAKVIDEPETTSGSQGGSVGGTPGGETQGGGTPGGETQGGGTPGGETQGGGTPGGETGETPSSGTTLLSVRAETNDKLLDFGKSFVNEPVKSNLIVKNIGTRIVQFQSTLVTSKEMQMTGGTCDGELLSMEECTIEVTFNSSSLGLAQDSAIITYSEKEIAFPLLGEKIQKKKQGPLVASEVFSNNIDFGKVKTSLTVTKQVEIQNLGETVYNVKDILLSNKTVFSIKSHCGQIIHPGTCLIDVSYSPTEVKKDSGFLTVTTIEGDSVELTLAGEGQESKVCESWNEYLVVPEKSYPASQVIFPYLKSHPSTTAKLSHLYGLEVNSYVKAIDNYAVADGMVYITFKLPAMTGTITNMNFGVKVLKVIRDNYKDTESLCLSSKGVRKCSGHEFSLASWQKLKNPKFWDMFTKPVSERYERQFASGERACGPFRCMDLNTQYELSDIFEMSEKEMQVIRREGTITLIFSDDTRMLKMPRIAIKTKTVKNCE